MMLGSQAPHSEKNLNRHLDYIILLYTKINLESVNKLGAKSPLPPKLKNMNWVCAGLGTGKKKAVFSALLLDNSH